MHDVQESASLSEARKNTIGLLAITGIALAFFYPLIFDGKVIFYRDFQFITYPVRYFLAQSFQQGVIPYWTPHSFAGMPFMATLHPGVFYPPSVLLLIGDITLAINLFYVFHFLVVGNFTFLLIRKWGGSFWAAMASGVTGMLSGYMLASTLCSNLFLGSVWLPMIFWLYYQFAESGRRVYFVGLIAAIVTQTLAACPEISAMTMIVLWAHALVFMPRELGRAGYVRVTGTLVLAVVVALGLSAFQLAPTAKLLEHTFRGGGLDYGFHTRWSLDPEKLASLAFASEYKKFLVANDPKTIKMFSGLVHSLYMGILGLALTVTGVLFARTKAVRFWIIAFAAGVFLALGSHNPLYEYIYKLTPFLNFFRYPEKYFFIASFAAVFLTGFVLDSILHAVRHRQMNLPALMGMLALVTAAVVWLTATYPQLKLSYPLAVIGIFAVLYLLFHYGKIPRRGFASSVLVLIIFDLFLGGMGSLPLMDKNFYEEKPLLMDQLAGQEGKYRVFAGPIENTPDPLLYPSGPSRLAGVRTAKQFLYPLQGMVFGAEHINGVPGLAMDIRNHIIWYQFLLRAEPEARRRILARGNVKYWIDADTPIRYSKEGYPLIFPDRVKPLENPLPRAFLVPQMQAEKVGTILETFYDEAFDPLQMVLLDPETEFEPSLTFSGEVLNVAYRPNGVTVQTSQKGSGFLVLMDTYLPGWTVKVDGTEQPILRANGLYRAVQLESGEHVLEFEYFPDGFKEGLMASGAVLFAGLIGILLWRPRLSPGGNTSSPTPVTPDTRGES